MQFFHIRWVRVPRLTISARVQFAFMTAVVLVATLAGSAGKRWV